MRLIDADALKKDLRDNYVYCGFSDLLNDFYSAIDAQPTADVVERKRGKWIRHYEVRNVYGGIYIECSECGEKYIVQHIEDEKYCRNCGAKMVKGEGHEAD